MTLTAAPRATGPAAWADALLLSFAQAGYVQAEPAHVLLAQPEIKSIQELNGKTIGVTALTDAEFGDTVSGINGDGLFPCCDPSLSSLPHWAR